MIEGESSTLFLYNLIQSLIQELTGEEPKNVSVVKINVNNLHKNGELSFVISMFAWKDYVSQGFSNVNNILEYYLYRINELQFCNSEDEIANKVATNLIALSHKWPLKIAKCCVVKNYMHIFFDRLDVITKTIKTTVQQDSNYGKNKSKNCKTFCLSTDSTSNSGLTKMRLDMLRNVTSNILKSQEHILGDDGEHRYTFTTKSQGKCINIKYVCGLVKTADSDWTRDTHFDMIYTQLKKFAEEKYLDKSFDKNVLQNIANAVIIFDMLSVKPSKTLFFKNTSDCDGSIKGVTFLLYNTARLAAIFKKYNEKQTSFVYPELVDVDEIDFSLLNQEEEWKLVYNFVLYYPQLLHQVTNLGPNFEINPQFICTFIQRLCQLFSIYYRKTRILMEGYSHLIPTIMARMYLLRAVNIVLLNSLSILNISPVECM